MNRNPTLAVIIDPPLLLDALMAVFQQHFPNVTLLGSSTGAEALRLVTVPGQPVDIAVISDALPDIPGDLLAKRLCWYAPHLRIVMADATLARRPGAAHAGGAARVAPSGVEPAAGRSGSRIASLVAAIRRLRPDLAAVPGVATGPTTAAAVAPVAPLPGDTASAVLSDAVVSAAAGAPDGESTGASVGTIAGTAAPRGGVLPARGPFGPQRLTPRQMEVLGLLAQGWRNSTIAEHLHTSEKTVKAHVSAVFQVLDVSNRTQATLVAQRSGLVPA
ncbi:response regulator transcription factor [Robbsia sp. Bb-Pol-6]|uniref:Response regulator transcription factor n=1 Tax=Robbsia betulipollinis TaxID=2981849 RepID=A0ABT3ZP74_9BURK|nr:response regulator transcription factor [Robbsia betulipollinis]MCY0388272.1 response regulator transcription factor [Robbsia betulipollinis]